MSTTNIHLSFENRLKLRKDSGTLIHAFGEGYIIIDENGREVNAIKDENEFNRLIEKFRYRHFLIERLNDLHNNRFDFGEDNTLMINGKTIDYLYWDLPKDESDVDLYFQIISDEFTAAVD
jgi:hypothetical protein